MSYYNPIFCMGEKKFVDEASSAGVDGVIIPDLPPEEARDFIRYANRKGLSNICFIAPTTSRERMKFICRLARGFIYYVSLTGVTGQRRSLSAGLKENLARVKKMTSLPVCAGFGISSAAQLKDVQSACDGGIVGSAIVSRIRENLKRRDMVKRVGNFVGRFR